MTSSKEAIFKSETNVQHIVAFLDSKLSADVTNIVVRYLGDRHSSTVVVFAEVIKQHFPLVHPTRIECTSICVNFDSVQFGGIVDYDGLFRRCCVTWTRHLISATMDEDGYQPPSQYPERERRWAFERFIQMDHLPIRGVHRSQYLIVICDFNSRFVINDFDDIAWQIHRMLPLRFRSR